MTATEAAPTEAAAAVPVQPAAGTEPVVTEEAAPETATAAPAPAAAPEPVAEEAAPEAAPGTEAVDDTICELADAAPEPSKPAVQDEDLVDATSPELEEQAKIEAAKEERLCKMAIC